MIDLSKKINKCGKTFFDLASFGKRMEYIIIAQMLKEELDVYLPMVDDKGIDCIIRRSDGSFAEIQIKSRSNNVSPSMSALYAGIECMPRRNYWYVFWSEGINNGTMWIMNSFEFVYYASRNKKGNNVGKYTISLNGCKKNKDGNLYAYPKKSTEKFISKNFSRIELNYLLIENYVNYDEINMSKNKPWDIFNTYPMLLYHPSDRKMIVAVSKFNYKNKLCLQIWSLDYIADMNMGGLPGSSHECILIKDVKMKWHSELNQWHIWSKSDQDWIYKFALPTENIKVHWDKIKKYVPSLKELQRYTDEIYDNK